MSSRLPRPAIEDKFELMRAHAWVLAGCYLHDWLYGFVDPTAAHFEPCSACASNERSSRAAAHAGIGVAPAGIAAARVERSR
jgi:hypothetical protein